MFGEAIVFFRDRIEEKRASAMRSVDRFLYIRKQAMQVFVVLLNCCLVMFVISI
jgi:hypothetical protein